MSGIGDDKTTRMERGFYLANAMQEGVLLAKSGLAILEKHGADDDRHYMIMFLLSAGLERLMKVLLSLRHYHKTEKFLGKQSMTHKFSHDLQKLKNAIVEECYPGESLSRPAIREDVQFLREDVLLNRLLDALTQFGTRGRYFYLDASDIPHDDAISPSELWEGVESLTMDRDDVNKLLLAGEIERYFEHARKEITVCLERFLRALARTVTLTGLKPDAQSLGTAAFEFLMLTDSQLGTRHYEL